MWTLLLLLGCNSNPSTPPDGGPDPDAVSSTIGPAGGTLAAPGLRLVVPRGALGEEVTLVVTPGADPIDHEAWSTVWHFEPVGLVFQRAATVSFVIEPPGEAAVWWSDAAGVEARPSRFADGMVSAPVWHFSTGWVGPAPAVDTSPGETGRAATDTSPGLGGDTSVVAPVDTGPTTPPRDSTAISPPQDSAGPVHTDLPRDTAPPVVIETGWPDPGDETGLDSSVGARFCPEGMVVNCFGVCVPDDRGDGQCDRWLACERLVWDGGDCDGPREVPDPVCPPGTMVSCWGTCEPAQAHTNGTCDEIYACPRRDWDGGDCPLPGGSRLRASVTIDDPSDLAQLAGVSQLAGALVIADGAPADIVLPDLVTLQVLTVRSDSVETVSLPALTHVTRDARVYEGAALRAVSLPSLRVIGGDLSAWDDTAALSVPQLTHVGHGVDVDLRGSPGDELVALQTVGFRAVVRGTALPALVSVGSDLDVAEPVDLPALVSVGNALALDVGANDVVVPALATIGGEATLRGSGSLSLPALRDATWVYAYELRSLALDMLISVGPLRARLAPDGQLRAARLDWAGELDVQAASLHAPLLSGAANAWLDVETADLSGLRSVRETLLHQRGAIVLPALASVGALRLEGGSLRADLLTQADWVDVQAGASVHLATLPAARLLDVHATVADAITAPALAAVEVVTARADQPVSLPGLAWSRRMWVGGAAGIGLPALATVGATTDWPLAPDALLCGDGFVEDDGLTVAGALSAPALTGVTALRVDTSEQVPSLDGLAALHDAGAVRVEAPSELPPWALNLPVVRVRRLLLDDLRGGPLQVELPELAELGHASLVQSAAISALSLPAATHIASLELRGTTHLETLHLPAWSVVDTPLLALECRAGLVGPGDGGPGLAVDQAPLLQAVALPSLGWLPRLALTRLTALTEVSLPQVTAAGSVVISEQDDVAWSEITTDQLTEPPGALRLDWPLLTTVDDLFLLHERRITELELGLTDITSRLRLHDLPRLTRVSLPALVEQSGPGWLNFVHDPLLTAVDLPQARVVGRLGFVDTGMTAIDYPGIERVLDHISVYENPALRRLSLPAAQDALQLYLDDNPLMEAVELPSLLTVQRLRVDHQGALQALALPALTDVATAMNIGGNPLLTSLQLPSLTHVDELHVVDNPLLPECTVDPLAWGVAGTIEIAGNAACGP